MANRLRASRLAHHFVDGVWQRIPTRRGEDAGDGAPSYPPPPPPPSPSPPSPPPSPSPPSPPRSTCPRPYEPYLVGIRSYIPQTSVWRSRLIDLPDDSDPGAARVPPRHPLLTTSASRVSPDVEKDDAGKGLQEDREITWPPMVIVMNTSLQKDSEDKWKGMDNQELLDCFREYKPARAYNACGSFGQLGMSVLEFESSAAGYMEAERLHRHFVSQGTGRDAWRVRRPQFIPGGERQLFGFMARKPDLEVFNKHCRGKSCLKYEMKSYNEMVVMQLKQRSEHPEYEQEMKYKEDSFHRQIEDIHKATKDKEKLLKKLWREERSKARRFDVDSGTTEDRKLRKEHVEKFINCQVKDEAEFEAERDELIKVHEEKKMKLKKEYMEKDLALQRELEAAVTGLEQVELNKLMKEHNETRLKLKDSSLKKELEHERGLGAALMALIDKQIPTVFETSLLP